MKALTILSILVAVLTTPVFSDEIIPIGDENLGRLLVKLPTGAIGKEVLKFRLFFRDKSIDVGTVSERFVKGKGCLKLVWFDAGMEMRDCDIEILPKKTVEYELALINAKYDLSSFPKPAVEHFGASLNPKDYYRDLEFRFGSPLHPLPKVGGLSGNSSYYNPLLAGSLVVLYPYPLTKQESLGIPHGSTHQLDLIWDKPQYPEPGQLEVLSPIRKCQSIPTGHVGVPNNAAFFASSCNIATKSFATLDTAKTETYVVYPAAIGQCSVPYTLSIPQLANNAKVSIPFQIRSGEKTQIKLHRIDVRDPIVTKETGETYTVKGKYSLFRENNGKWELIHIHGLGHIYPTGSNSVFLTETGVDLFAGEYKVVAQIPTAEGTQIKDYFVTFSSRTSRDDLAVEIAPQVGE